MCGMARAGGFTGSLFPDAREQKLTENETIQYLKKTISLLDRFIDAQMNISNPLILNDFQSVQDLRDEIASTIRQYNELCTMESDLRDQKSPSGGDHVADALARKQQQLTGDLRNYAETLLSYRVQAMVFPNIENVILKLSPEEGWSEIKNAIA